MRGWYLATVPKSSLARVRRVLATHIMEEEAEDEADEHFFERRWTARCGRENRRENNHIMSEMGWSEKCDARQI